jgi:hypothetical protein
MELHDDKNGVKDRILDDLSKSIKLVRRTLLCVSFHITREPFEVDMIQLQKSVVNIDHMVYSNQIWYISAILLMCWV